MQKFLIIACKTSGSRVPMMLPGLYDSAEAAQEAADRVIPNTHTCKIIESPKLTPTMRAIINTLADESAYLSTGTYIRGPMYYKVHSSDKDFEGRTVRSDIFHRLFHCGILKRLPKKSNAGSIVDQRYVLSRGARANFLSSPQ